MTDSGDRTGVIKTIFIRSNGRLTESDNKAAVLVNRQQMVIRKGTIRENNSDLSHRRN